MCRATRRIVGIDIDYKSSSMTADLLTLLRRDHDELGRALAVMVEPRSSDRDLCDAIGSVHLGLAVHTEAERAMLRAALESAHPPGSVYELCAQVVGAHLSQERALASLDNARRGTAAWRELAAQLRSLFDHHDEHEFAQVIPALRESLSNEAYGALAGSYASARLRALGTVPIALIFEDDVDLS